jgi:hypothetical protein
VCAGTVPVASVTLILLGPGGFGGIINMSYAMNAMIHNTSWVTAHFHLIYGGAVVIDCFAIAYELWPRLTGRPLASKRLACCQLWIWFWGMLITTVPWHIAGLMGQPRRYAIFDYPDPSVAKTAPLVLLSVVGGALVLCSVLLFFYVLVRSSPTPVAEFMPPMQYAIAVYPPAAVPRLLNGFAFWNVMLLVLMVIAYAYPIGQFFYLHKHDSPLSNDGTGGEAILGRTRRDCSRGAEVIGSQDLDVGSFTTSSARSFSKQVDQRHWPHPSPASLRVRASESSTFFWATCKRVLCFRVAGPRGDIQFRKCFLWFWLRR